MESRLTYKLSELDSSKVFVAGGKGASLGELIRAGAPVPPGFVITRVAFEAFMKGADPEELVTDIVRRVDGGQIQASQGAAQIKAHLAEACVPEEIGLALNTVRSELGSKRVSVRSSATCEDSGSSAWAGQLHTYLDVPPEHILERIRDCWLSIYSEPALAYGAAHGYGAGQFAVAVVVQEMVASDVAGIGFSVHPVTQEPNVLLIEACLGLGEAIVSGTIVPDQYIIERSTNTILERSTGGQNKGLFIEEGASQPVWRDLGERGGTQKLTDDQILEYAELLSRIQDHYGHPVDTEWALQDGRFRLLQARPITTLAEEYQEAVIDVSEEWQPAVRRALSLMEVSIWAHWLDWEHAGESLGLHWDRVLSIQDDAGMVNQFLSKVEFEANLDQVLGLYRNDRPRLLEILQHGHALYRESQARIEQGPDAFRDLNEAAEFMVEVAQYTGVFPAFALMVYEKEQLEDPEIRGLAEGLRAHSLVPPIERRIIDPLAAKATKALGFSTPEVTSAVATWRELQQGTLDSTTLEARLQAIRAGRRYVFQSIGGQDQVRFVSQTGYLLMRLAKQRQIVNQDNPNELTGQGAWPGVYRGRARVILAPDAVGQTIEDGEVLVSIQSSPALMPLLQRCGAIVTDDGGIACHAAIICRELRKPTLIGTRSATSVIKTGDFIEVDAYAQVVRILEPATSD